MNLDLICSTLRNGAEKLALQNSLQKNKALESVIFSIEKNRNQILEANKKDLEKAAASGMSAALIERLSLDNKKIDSMMESMKIVIAQTDPIGEETSGWKTPNGMTIRQVRVPIGVVAIIYESRPNVTVDAFCLAYKSGNAILLRGSSSAYNSNKVLVKAIKEGLADGSGVTEALELVEVESGSYEDVQQILTATGRIDVVLPRGGAKLIQNVVQNARIPVIETGSGICHLFVDESADLDMAAKIAENAKIQRPGACNAIECILVHKKILKEFLPKLEKILAGRVELRADDDSFAILKSLDKNGKVIKAEDSDFGFEFLDFVCTIKTIENFDKAVEYINTHNTKHSDCIVTNDRNNAINFQQRIDSSCVYVNSSTRFTDGGEFGFGAELGISTQKLHARGPMGIEALTTTKYLIDGNGQTR